eukprot:CAMPEP_0195258492 /NCGR_PEP_ID=MMETSP0706-20130129/7434_1 /TAXON_ID=33640 /ORGANISM="Asterionellopsis glacialis, Strain CCMP134" /LENGTH=228 /DNA_ID=CAMNT_0040311877 /DNA_START=119 /DNA_END=805 /DNA_ORIENTATION=+
MSNTDVQPSAGSLSSLMGAMSSVKEKWDASGANEAMASVSGQIPQGTRDYFTSNKIFNREHIRTLTVFFGLGEDRPFYVERSPSLLMERLRHNFMFFYLNYSMMTALLFLLTLIVSPSAIIGIALLGAAWLYVIKATQEGSMKIGPINVSQKVATLGMAGISILVLMRILAGVFWWTLFSSGFLVGAHAFSRDASLHKDEEDKVVMSGDLTLNDETSFLNEDAQPDVV